VIKFRQGNIKDVEAVYHLNKENFSEPWSRASLYSAIESGYSLLLCESDDMLVGYLLSLSVLDEVQIMQIAVSDHFRRQGLASRMTHACVRQNNTIYLITLEVRRSNHAARQCYAQLGFKEAGYRKRYYKPNASGFREDAVLMSKHI